MYNQRVIDVSQLPISLEERKYTDVICTWLHSIFILTVLGFAIFFLNHNANIQSSKSCPQMYRQLWSQSNDQVVMCVQVCPNNYQSIDEICYPLQEQQLKRSQWNQSNFKTIILFIIIFILSISLAFLTISYFSGRIFQRFLIILVIGCLIYLVLMILNVLNTPYFLDPFISNINIKNKQVYIVIIAALAVFLVAWLVCFNKELSWNGLMLDYASKILPQRVAFIFFIFKFYVGVAIIFCLFAFQFYVFSHSSNVFFSWTVEPHLTALVIVNIFEFFWNLQYLKDTLYFSLANLTTSYYYSKQMDICMNISLNCIHAGSASGGSLIGTIFYLPNCLIDTLCCYPQQKRQNCGLCFSSFTGIARNDAYSYQSLAAIPYCNSSRQCRRLSNQTNFWIGVNSPLANYRFFVHTLTNMVCIIFGMILMKGYDVQINSWRILVVFIISQSLMSGLIDILIIMAQCLQTSLLVDASISNQNEFIYMKSKLCEGDLKTFLHSRQPPNPFSD